MHIPRNCDYSHRLRGVFVLYTEPVAGTLPLPRAYTGRFRLLPYRLRSPAFLKPKAREIVL